MERKGVNMAWHGGMRRECTERGSVITHDDEALENLAFLSLNSSTLQWQ